MIATYGKFAAVLFVLPKTVAGPAFQAGVCGTTPLPVPGWVSPLAPVQRLAWLLFLPPDGPLL